MKWNILVGSLVVGLAMCSQSFGFELLDRMLGLNSCGGCGECAEEKQCCRTFSLPKRCCQPPQPKCCPQKPACAPKTDCCRPLLGGLKGLGCCEKPTYAPKARCCTPKPKCCPAPAPKAACCAPKASCGCQHGRLLDRLHGLFDRCCDQKPAAGKCNGCEAGVMEEGDAAPMPPAPIVDPSAFVPPSKRYIMHAGMVDAR